VIIPIHYNTFDLLKQDEHAWAERVQKETKTRVVLLKPGESYTVESK
jgi:L-ascorbate metabolism protein UlaG (beta-lactamase superfamily)